MKNIFSWSITFKGEIDTSVIKSQFFITNLNDFTNIFLYWETDFLTSKELIEDISKKIFWEVLNYDISISTEDKISIISDLNQLWEYQNLTFSWVWISFQNILDKYKNETWVVSVREAEVSKFWNRTVKVDFVK